MRDRILDTTLRALVPALMLFLPWSVPVWTAAGIYYLLSGGDRKGPDAGLVVVLAPALPAIVLVDALGRILPK